jgi:hypothetical protein
MKQVAYNQRILEAENEISGINCDVSDFLSGMTVDPEEQLVICVNGSQEMKRHEQAMAGQLWMQSDRKMTAANPAYDGMGFATKIPLTPCSDGLSVPCEFKVITLSGLDSFNHCRKWPVESPSSNM